jgi:hypothetical protein
MGTTSMYQVLHARMFSFLLGVCLESRLAELFITVFSEEAQYFKVFSSNLCKFQFLHITKITFFLIYFLYLYLIYSFILFIHLFFLFIVDIHMCVKWHVAEV